MHVRDLCKEAHATAKKKGFWECYENGDVMPRNDGEIIALMHSELSEALEALRHPDEKHNNVGEEMADCCIRIFDYCEAKKIDLEKEIADKMAKNKARPFKHGKKF
jgi:NTP pyrophosphatase (non-canonical NTP hydrolase)